MPHFDIPFEDKNSERKMLYRRIEQICRDVRALVFDQSVRVKDVWFRDGQYAWNEIDKGDWRPFGDEEYWGSREMYCWFRQKVTIPESFRGRQVVYAVNPLPESGWHTSCFQFILFVDGKMVQGMDSNHSYAILTDCAAGGETYDIALNAYCDDNEFRGQAKFHAYLQTRDTVARNLYYDLSVALGAAHQYGTDDLPRVHILKALNTAVNMLDLFSDNADRFRESAKQASEYLHANLYGTQNAVRVSAIGHTHIDTAWRWRLRQTREKAARSFATVLALMHEYPEYKFMSPQAQLYDYVRQDYPMLFEAIAERIREGRWEAEGSMWVESDTNVISGESLVRQFLVGKRFFREMFGKDNKIMWLPDVFGYSASLPQIMKLAGIDYFMTTKISWSEMDRHPFDTFLWQGIDGSEVLSHFIPSMSANAMRNGFQTTYTANLDPEHMINGWRRYANKDLNENWLCSYGHGDGGGGPERSMLENGKRMREGVEGCPHSDPEFARTFFDRLSDKVKDDPHLPRWRGELYLEFHRGTLTSQARNKRYNRKSEFLLHDCETLQTLSHNLTGSDYPAEALLENWKLVLLNQFHDILPGSSIEPVYTDSKEQYEQVLSSGVEMAADAIACMTARMHLSEDAIVVFNTLGFNRTDLAACPVPAEQPFVLLDSDGSELPYQISYDGNLLFLAKDVPAKGFKSFRLRKGTPTDFASRVQTDGTTFETPYLCATFDVNCNIARLVHKRSGRSVSPEGETIGQLMAFEDRPNVYDAWEVKTFYDEKFRTIDDVESCDVIETGALRTVLRIVRRFQSSRIVQDYIFYSDKERIDVQYTIDWHEKHILLKADYPVDVNTSRATFDIQFGNLERTTHNNTTWDAAQFEVCGHKWADLSDNSFGLSVLNDCKYGWTVKNGHIRPSILRCATDLNPNQDREMHYVTYALYPHEGAVQDSCVVQEGYQLNVPLYTSFAHAHNGDLPSEYRGVACDADNVIIETVKKAEDSDAVIVRSYETWNRRTDCKLTFARPIRKAYITNLLEDSDEPVETDGESVSLTYKPFQIQTLKVLF